MNISFNIILLCGLIFGVLLWFDNQTDSEQKLARWWKKRRAERLKRKYIKTCEMYHRAKLVGFEHEMNKYAQKAAKINQQLMRLEKP